MRPEEGGDFLELLLRSGKVDLSESRGARPIVPSMSFTFEASLEGNWLEASMVDRPLRKDCELLERKEEGLPGIERPTCFESRGGAELESTRFRSAEPVARNISFDYGSKMLPALAFELAFAIRGAIFCWSGHPCSA